MNSTPPLSPGLRGVPAAATSAPPVGVPGELRLSALDTFRTLHSLAHGIGGVLETVAGSVHTPEELAPIEAVGKALGEAVRDALARFPVEATGGSGARQSLKLWADTLVAPLRTDGACSPEQAAHFRTSQMRMLANAAVTILQRPSEAAEVPADAILASLGKVLAAIPVLAEADATAIAAGKLQWGLHGRAYNRFLVGRAVIVGVRRGMQEVLPRMPADVRGHWNKALADSEPLAAPRLALSKGEDLRRRTTRLDAAVASLGSLLPVPAPHADEGTATAERATTPRSTGDEFKG